MNFILFNHIWGYWVFATSVTLYKTGVRLSWVFATSVIPVLRIFRCIKQEFSHHFRHLLRPKPDDLWSSGLGQGSMKRWDIEPWWFISYYLETICDWPLSFILFKLREDWGELSTFWLIFYLLLGNDILWPSPFFFWM